MTREREGLNPPQNKLSLITHELQVVRAGDTFSTKPLFYVHKSSNGDKREDVEIYVAPKAPTFYHAGLNAFMESLIQSCKPDDLNPASYQDFDGGKLAIGRMLFYDIIGKKRIQSVETLTACDKEAFARLELNEGTNFLEKQERSIYRGTTLRTLPHPYLAQLLYDYKKGRQDETIKYSDLLAELELHIPESVINAFAKDPQAAIRNLNRDLLKRRVPWEREHQGFDGF